MDIQVTPKNNVINMSSFLMRVLVTLEIQAVFIGLAGEKNEVYTSSGWTSMCTGLDRLLGVHAAWH